MKLTQLNVDVLFNIFKGLDILDVISVSKIDKYFSNVAAGYLSHRFSKKLVIFDISNRIISRVNKSSITAHMLEPLPVVGQSVVETVETIKFENANDIVEYVMNLIGGEIRKLEIIDYEYNPLGDEAINIFQLIEKKCSKTLVELHVNRLKTFFDIIETPFDKIEKLSWSNYKDETAYTVNLDKSNFQTYFPSLRNLKLSNAPVANTSFNIPNLEHFGISYAQGESTLDFLRANRQLKSLDLWSIDLIVLKFIADEMPNVEKLRIYLCQYEQNVNVSFKHLKSINIAGKLPAMIEFNDKLEEFISFYFPNEKYIRFLSNNSNVKMLKIELFVSISQVQELISAKLGVRDLNLCIAGEINPEIVIQLIESCQFLKKFIFQVGQAFDKKNYDEWDNEQILIKHFSHWNFNRNDKIYSMTRNTY